MRIHKVRALRQHLLFKRLIERVVIPRLIIGFVVGVVSDNFFRKIVNHIEDLIVHVESVKHLSSLFVDNFALCVHHVVVTEHLLSYGVVSAFDETLRLFDLLGDDTV